MARYERLPIVKAALDLTVYLEKLVAGFSRVHKYLRAEIALFSSRTLLQTGFVAA